MFPLFHPSLSTFLYNPPISTDLLILFSPPNPSPFNPSQISPPSPIKLLDLEKTQPLSKTSSSVPLLNHSLQLPEGSPIPRNHSHSVLCHPIALHKCSALSFLSFWPLPPSPRQDQALRFTNLPVSTPRSELYPCFISSHSFRLEVRWLRWFVERGLLRNNKG